MASGSQQNDSTGWRNQPNERGTFDIIKTCVGTILLLCWSSVCPNVPKLHSGRWSQMGGRLELFLLSILGPDFTFMVALGQLNMAHRDKKSFHAKGYQSWTLRHCYFVNMGGLHLAFPSRVENTKHPSFPVDCHQLLQLVDGGHMDIPEITEAMIEERNKTDELARAITLIQSAWFTVETLARLAQGLHTTTLELTTLAFVFLMAGCAICWWRKPMDISLPHVIKVEKDLAVVIDELRLNAPEQPSRHDRTPLSFLNRHEWFMSQFWFYYTELLRRLKLMPRRACQPGEADHFETVQFPEIDIKFEVFGAGPMVIAYSGIFIAGWNFAFPTALERTLWQAASIICLAYGVVGCFLAWSWHHAPVVKTWVARIRHTIRRTTGSPSNPTGPESTESAGHHGVRSSLNKINHWFDWMRNISPEGDPALAVPVRLWTPTTFLCVAYCLSRGYILVEDFVGLRSVPKSAYSTVDWGQFSPIL